MSCNNCQNNTQCPYRNSGNNSSCNCSNNRSQREMFNNGSKFCNK